MSLESRQAPILLTLHRQLNTAGENGNPFSGSYLARVRSLHQSPFRCGLYTDYSRSNQDPPHILPFGFSNATNPTPIVCVGCCHRISCSVHGHRYIGNDSIAVHVGMGKKSTHCVGLMSKNASTWTYAHRVPGTLSWITYSQGGSGAT